MNEKKASLEPRRHLLVPLACEAGIIAFCLLMSCAHFGLTEETVVVHVLILLALAVTDVAVYVAEKVAFRSESKAVLAVAAMAACVVGACAFYCMSWLTSPRRELIVGDVVVSLAMRSFCRAAACAALTLVLQHVVDMMAGLSKVDDTAGLDDLGPWDEVDPR